MKIGSIDIAMFEAKQQRVSIDHATINNNSEWAAGSRYRSNCLSREAEEKRSCITALISLHCFWTRWN